VVRPAKPDPDHLTLTRSVAAPPALGTQEYDNASILYLKPGALTAGRVDEIAAKIRAAPKGKILLDLRDATGDAAQGLRLANFFVKEGTLATLQGQQFPTQSFTADPAIFLPPRLCRARQPRHLWSPELAANAIEDLKRGDVVGERTFGEDLSRNPSSCPAAQISCSRLQNLRALRNKIQDNAVTPNVVVASPLDDQEEGAAPTKGDDMLNKALDLLKAKSS